VSRCRPFEPAATAAFENSPAPPAFATRDAITHPRGGRIARQAAAQAAVEAKDRHLESDPCDLDRKEGYWQIRSGATPGGLSAAPPTSTEAPTTVSSIPDSDKLGPVVALGAEMDARPLEAGGGRTVVSHLALANRRTPFFE
jgi:hypothetical protein